jgi:hypothetical protein
MLLKRSISAGRRWATASMHILVIGSRVWTNPLAKDWNNCMVSHGSRWVFAAAFQAAQRSKTITARGVPSATLSMLCAQAWSKNDW